MSQPTDPLFTPRHTMPGTLKLYPVLIPSPAALLLTVGKVQKGLSFISNSKWRKEVKFCVSELGGIEPTPHTPEEQGKVQYNH